MASTANDNFHLQVSKWLYLYKVKRFDGKSIFIWLYIFAEQKYERRTGEKVISCLNSTVFVRKSVSFFSRLTAIDILQITSFIWINNELDCVSFSVTFSYVE